MNVQKFVRRVRLPVPVEEAFAWHERRGALERLIPPWEPVEILESSQGVGEGQVVGEGQRVKLRSRVGPLPVVWVVEHRDYKPGRQFRDVALCGPFSYWDHLHAFEPEGPSDCILEDRIEYRIPAGVLGRTLAAGHVERQLQRMFRYRHDTTLADLKMHAAWADWPRLRVAVSGSHGLVGSALVPVLTTGGHEVVRLRRRQSDNHVAVHGTDGAEGTDAVVHLAGENIAAGRWSPSQKRQLRDSRVEVTRTLCENLARLAQPPRTLVCASAIGFYGNQGDEWVDEQSPSGEGFLAEVCQQWEAACAPARDAGIRVVNLRFGAVLSPRGGALAKMVTPFRLGLGGRVGDGRQYVSWISIDDAVGTIHHAVMNDQVAGPVNAVAPNPATNQEFTRTLAAVVRRPALVPVPATAARLALGEMADGLLFCSTRVRPLRLDESGYRFRHVQLEHALRHVLGAW